MGWNFAFQAPRAFRYCTDNLSPSPQAHKWTESGCQWRLCILTSEFTVHMLKMYCKRARLLSSHPRLSLFLSLHLQLRSQCLWLLFSLSDKHLRNGFEPMLVFFRSWSRHILFIFTQFLRYTQIIYPTSHLLLTMWRPPQKFWLSL